MSRRHLSSRTFKASIEHTCDIGKFTVGDGSSAALPGIGGSWDDDYAETVQCLMTTLSGTHTVRTDKGSEIRIDYMIEMAYRADLAGANAQSLYRMVNVKDAAGTVLETGPHRILVIKDPGGIKHHMEIAVSRQRIPVA